MNNKKELNKKEQERLNKSIDAIKYFKKELEENHELRKKLLYKAMEF